MGTSLHAASGAGALPAHVRLIANEHVWMEGAAVEQLARVAASPGCVRAVGMPDLHAGAGFPLGAVFAIAERVYPALVGSDAGCGVRVAVVSRARHHGDDLFRRAAAEMDAPLALALDAEEAEAVFTAAWSRGPRGLADLDFLPSSLRSLAAEDPEHATFDELGPSATPPWSGGPFAHALGTIGGGNHFLEVARAGDVHERAKVELGLLENGALAIVAHSGSRGLGRALVDRWGAATLTGDALRRYLGELAGACRFARANRLVLVWRMLGALGALGRVTAMVDLVHNAVCDEEVDGARAWIHRKGCAPARAGEVTVVLGSRGAPSFLMEGLGSADALASVAHGAGRKMTRGEALAKLKAKHTRASLQRTKLGSRVLCHDTDALFEEHPDAYKPIEPVIASLVDAGAARPLATLTPILTVKA